MSHVYFAYSCILQMISMSLVLLIEFIVKFTTRAVKRIWDTFHTKVPMGNPCLWHALFQGLWLIHIDSSIGKVALACTGYFNIQ